MKNGINFKPVILILDDDEDLLKLYSLWLSPLGFIRTASNGSDGWVSLKTRQPDIMIVDLLMPVVDGYQFLRMVSDDPILINIPVILNTGAFAGLGSDKDAQMLQKVVNVFLFKPVTRKQMIDSVSKIIESMKDHKHDGID